MQITNTACWIQKFNTKQETLENIKDEKDSYTAYSTDGFGFMQ